ncbi:vignain [Ziziphus jujuba]|nr:vignain [Ziziphus jujuba]
MLHNRQNPDNRLQSPLSAQELIDNYPGSGHVEWAFDYIKTNGIACEADYPWKGEISEKNENIVSLEPVVKYDNGGTNESGHAMVIVGQGQNEYYEKYWHVKNTWGEGWGDEGYARLAKSVSDPNRAYYPIYYPLIHED